VRLIFRVFRALRSSFSHLSATNPANLVEETDNPAHESSRPPRYPISVNPLSPNLTKRLAIALAFCCLAAVSVHAAPSPIKIDLVSEARAIVPGETFTAAIRQRMKPGYHTYWRNPGTVGLATSMKWRLPMGFSAGEIQWQLPELTTMAAYTVWGYEKEALLLVDITPPKSLTTGDKVVLRGEAAWMCCGKQCHPGFQELSLALPVADKAKPNKRLKRAFDRVRAQQPIHSDAWKIECTTTGEDYTLRITPASKKATTNPGAIRFFDYDRQISSDKPQILKRDGASFVLKLKAEEHTPDELETLEGILVAENGWESGRGSHALKTMTAIKRTE
jgi:DsbC/DsbD-like thiol-disulfide interchange protein